VISRVLIVGSGNISKRHFALAQELIPGVQIRRLRHLLSTSYSNDSAEDITSMDGVIQFQPDIAVICNPATQHLEMAKLMSQLGAHLFIEKPLSDSLEGVHDFIQSYEARSTLLLLGYNLRHSDSLGAFRKAILSGLIGRSLSVRCEVGQYLPNWRPNLDYRQTVSAKKELGGGVLLELSHEFDYLRWIFGEVKWVRATLSKQSDLEINVEDSAHLVLGFSNSEANGQLIASINMDFIRQDPTRNCTVIGEKGTLRWDAINSKVSFFEPKSGAWSTLYSGKANLDDTYRSEWKYFLECIEEKKSPEVGGQDGLRVLEIIDAIRISAIDGHQVMVLRSQHETTSEK
jgi:predicted dehydrogenase